MQSRADAIQDWEIPDERVHPQPPVIDLTLGTPWSRVPPLALWQGAKYAVMKLPASERPVWILYEFTNPTAYEKLEFKESNEWKTNFRYHFGPERRERFLQVRKDELFWDYYMNDRFSGYMDKGAWVEIDAGKQLTKNQLILIGEEEKSETERYKRNPCTGIVRIFTTGQEDDTIIEEIPKTLYEELMEEVQKFKQVKCHDSPSMQKEDATKDQIAWYDGNELLNKMNENQEVKDCKEAIKKKNWGQLSEMKDAQPWFAWTELCKAKHIKTDLIYQTKDKLSETIFPLEGENDESFPALILLPELHLYPKTFLELLKWSDSLDIKFCGSIKQNGQVVVSTVYQGELYINAKKRSVMKIQQAFHQYICEKYINLLKQGIPRFEPYWKTLNLPGFEYNTALKQAPEGLTGFLTFQSLLSYENDVQDIFFALMKDPKTVLEHSDSIIAKKAQFFKGMLTEIHSNLNEDWWKTVQDHKDIWEETIGTTEFFKEVNLKNFDSPDKKGKK